MVLAIILCYNEIEIIHMVHSTHRLTYHAHNIFCDIARYFSSKETVTITYIDPSGDELPVEAEVGKHLLDVAHDNNIELEGKWRYKMVFYLVDNQQLLLKIKTIS